MARSIHQLDNALGWPEGTAWNLVTVDRASWSAEQLAAEEAALRHPDGIQSASEAPREDIGATPPQPENHWQRLRRPVDARRAHLGITQEGIAQRGGPSALWRVYRGEGQRQQLNAALNTDMAAGICTDTENGWLWYCDEHDTHGNADSRDEAESMAEAHVLYFDDLEGSDDRNPCPMSVWSRRRGSNQVAE